MITDFADLCTGMDVLLSDLSQPMAPSFHRPGPEPACRDTELLTMALVSEWDHETDLIARWHRHSARLVAGKIELFIQRSEQA